MINWFRCLLMKGYDWKVITQPSLFPSGCWADPKLWNEEHDFPSYWKAWRFASKYIAEHPFGIASIHFRKRLTEGAAHG